MGTGQEQSSRRGRAGTCPGGSGLGRALVARTCAGAGRGLASSRQRWSSSSGSSDRSTRSCRAVNHRCSHATWPIPTGVVVLADGTVLVAERGADRVTGFGGRLGPEPVPVVSVPCPTGLAVAANGSVFVTASTPAGGEVGRIDVATRQYSALATGFGSPAGPAVRGDVLYVPDLQTGDVRSIDIATGAELVAAASGLRGPAGATSAPGLPLFVTEAAGNAIVRVDPVGRRTIAFRWLRPIPRTARARSGEPRPRQRLDARGRHAGRHRSLRPVGCPDRSAEPAVHGRCRCRPGFRGGDWGCSDAGGNPGSSRGRGQRFGLVAVDSDRCGRGRRARGGGSHRVPRSTRRSPRARG